MDDGYSFNPGGVAVLDMSKRIIFEVLDIADRLGIDVMYTDTDSLHLREKEIPRLAAAYKKKYNKELEGEELGQFHSDFKKIKLNSGKKLEPFSVAFIPRARKVYIDLLVAEDPETGLCHVSQHKRMKGIPEKALEWHVEKHWNGDMLGFYEHLAAENPVLMPLNPTEHIFSFNTTGLGKGVSTVETGTFKRIVCFSKDENVEL